MPYSKKSSSARGRNKRARSAYALRRRARVDRIMAKRKYNTVPRNVVSTGIGLPKKLLTTHIYSEQIAPNTGATGQKTEYFWSCNSVYDPNRSGTGHQPMYFDQISALYDHYVVIGSECTFTVCKSDTNYNIPTMVGCMINDDTITTPTTGQGLAEQTLSKHRIITGYAPKTVFKMKWSAKKTFGKGVLSNNSLQGTGTTNPTEEQFYQFFIDSTVNLQQTSCMVDVKIKYIVMWVELKDIAQS